MTESYNRPPMSFTPSYEEDATGQQVFTGNGTLSTNGRAGIYETPYEEDQLTGDRRYLIEEQDFQQDAEYQPTEDYADTVLEVYPDLPDALAWAANNLDPITAQSFNEAVDGGDPDDYMPLLEALLEEYYASEGIEDDDDSDAYEPEEDVSEEELNEVVSELAESEPLGQQVAMPYLEMAVQYQSSHPCLSDICALTARFHNNEIEYGEAMDSLVAKYPLSELKKYYTYLNN